MKNIERILWIAGLLLLAVALFGWARGAYLSRRDVARFEQAQAAEEARLAAIPTPTPTPTPPPVTADELAGAIAEKLQDEQLGRDIADLRAECESWRYSGMATGVESMRQHYQQGTGGSQEAYSVSSGQGHAGQGFRYQ